MVRLTDVAGPTALQDLLKSLPANTTVVRDLDRLGRAVLQLPAGTDVAKVVTELKGRAGLAYAEPLFIDYGSE